MANTEIRIKHSTVIGNTPATLANGEIAINTADGKLYYSRPNGQITFISTSGAVEPAGLDGEIQFNDSGNLGASANLFFEKITGKLTSTTIRTNTYIEFADGTKQYTANAGGAATGYTGSIGYTGSQGALSSWNIITNNYSANDGDRLIANSAAGSFVITLPASPTNGDYIQITDGYNFEINNVIVYNNGNFIESYSDNVILDLAGTTFEFIWNGVSWQVTGTTGAKGNTGFTGSVGFTGSQGAGFTGSQGSIGFTGSVGFTGSQGAGFTGSKGDVGFTGSTGFTGSVGFTGSQGNVGFTGSAPTITLKASEALSAGDLVNIHNNSGSANVRKANATTSGKEAHGFVISSVNQNSDATVFLSGQTSSSYTGLSIGTVYLSTTGGLPTSTVPSSTNNVIQRVGVAVSANQIVFIPGEPIILS